MSEDKKLDRWASFEDFENSSSSEGTSAIEQKSEQVKKPPNIGST